jgi:hypothetical protein
VADLRVTSLNGTRPGSVCLANARQMGGCASGRNALAHALTIGGSLEEAGKGASLILHTRHGDGHGRSVTGLRRHHTILGSHACGRAPVALLAAPGHVPSASSAKRWLLSGSSKRSKGDGMRFSVTVRLANHNGTTGFRGRDPIRSFIAGSVQRLGVCGGGDMTGRAISGWGIWMGLVLQLVKTRADGGTRSVELMELGRPGNLHDIADLGLTLPEAKQLLVCVQQAVVVVQARDHATLRPDCASCGERFRIKDWRSRRVATLFGEVVVRLPRFRCPGCGCGETGTNWPAHCRSTPELDQLQAPLSALMTDRVAAGVLAHLLPVAAGTSHGTLRRHMLELGERLRDAATVEPDAADVAAAPAIALSLDATFIRSCHEGERHLEGRVGNAETPGGSRQLFGAVANAGTDIVALIRRTLDTMGRTSDTELTAFPDGCSSMRSILAKAGITDPPILDWFHLSLRLQHAKQAAGGLPADGPDRAQARAAIASGRH